MSKQSGKGRPANRRSIEIRDTPVVKTARTWGPWRIWEQLTAQDDTLDREDNTWRAHKGKVEEDTDRGGQPQPGGEQGASRTRKHPSDTHQDPSAFRTEKHEGNHNKGGEGPGDSTWRRGAIERYRKNRPRVDLVLLNMCAYRGVDPRRRHLVGQNVPCRYRPLVSASRQQYLPIEKNTPRSGV